MPPATGKKKKAAPANTKPQAISKQKPISNSSSAKKKPAAATTGASPAQEAAVEKISKKLPQRSAEGVRILSSKVSYKGPLFRVMTEEITEPGGKQATRDIIRHNGSIVILAVDSSKSHKDPLIIMEQQYRHAAGQFLVELPAGKLEAGEDPLEGAKRELIEETGYRAEKWTKLIRYFASPGFLGEWMQVYLAEDLTRGQAAPEEDESIDVAAVPLSKILKQIRKGEILDGKTLVSVLFYERLRKKKK